MSFLPVRRLPLIAALLAAVSLPARAGAEETVLIYQQSTRTVQNRPPDHGGVEVDSSRAELVVCLGDHRLTVYEPDRVWIYDFARGRMLTVDPAERTFSDWSLYSFVAFNELELASRLGRRDGGSGPPPRGTSILELEALFSLRSNDVRPGPRESLVDSSGGGGMRVMINGRVSMAATPSATTLTPARSAMFERFLLYRCHVHPAARRALMRANLAPQTLFYRYQDYGQETVVLLRLTRASSAPENNHPTRGLRQVDFPDTALAALAAQLQQGRGRCDDSVRATWADSSRRFEADALARGHYLDATLASAERGMSPCGGSASESWPEEVRKRVEADSMTQAYAAATRWRGPADAAAALEKLRSIDRAGLEKGYVIDLAMAKARIAAGDLEGGSQALIAALTRTPCAVQAWMDLAGAYMKDNQTVLAWMCFDVARAAAPPGCAAVSAGTAIEQDLARRHPEYFE